MDRGDAFEFYGIEAGTDMGRFVIWIKWLPLPSHKTERSSGCSAVRLAHLLWEQRVASSNLATPTREEDNECQRIKRNLFAR